MITKSIIAAGMGAASPNLLRLAIEFEQGVALPGATYLIGLSVFVALGCVIGWLFEERDVKRAFYMGIGLPALLQVGAVELGRDPADLQVSATAPGGGMHASSRGVSTFGAGFEAIRLERPAPGRQLRVVVAAGRPEGVKVEFIDDRGARMLRAPDARHDTVLSFRIPERATGFRVLSGNASARVVRLGPDALASFRVKITKDRWSGLRRAIGVDRSRTYVIQVQRIDDPPGRHGKGVASEFRA